MALLAGHHDIANILRDAVKKQEKTPEPEPITTQPEAMTERTPLIPPANLQPPT